VPPPSPENRSERDLIVEHSLAQLERARDDEGYLRVG
jgi:hypothetical protein